MRLPETAPLDGADFGGGGDWPAREWWKRYQDPTLDQLIALGAANSPSLATAHARFDTARQSVRLAAAASGAQVTASADTDRQRLSDNGIFPPQLLGFTWYNQSDLGLQASYTFDWWGKQRYAVEAAMDQAHAAQADRSAAALMLASFDCRHLFWLAVRSKPLGAGARKRKQRSSPRRKVTAARVRAELDLRMRSIVLTLRWLPHGNKSPRSRARRSCASSRWRRSSAGRSANCRRWRVNLCPLFRALLPDNVKIDLMARRADITASRWRVEAAERNLDSARAGFLSRCDHQCAGGVVEHRCQQVA